MICTSCVNHPFHFSTFILLIFSFCIILLILVAISFSLHRWVIEMRYYLSDSFQGQYVSETSLLHKVHRRFKSILRIAATIAVYL
jgi:hypothetical protein